MIRIASAWLLLLLLVGCSPDPELDLDQLEVRARAGERAAIVQLVELLGAPDTALADRVYRTLVETGQPVVPVLSERVLSDDRQLREYAIAALGTLKARSAVAPISQVLHDPKYQRRYVAAWALGEIGGGEVVPELIGALGDDNPEVRRYATRALIKLNELSVPPLVTYLKTAEDEGAAAAIRALGDIGDPVALPVLLDKTRGPQRAEAILALGKLRDPRAEQALIDGLGDSDWRVRMNAAMALGPLGGQAAEAPLRVLLDDNVHVVREWAARSLEMISGQPVVYRNSQGEMVRPYNVYH